METVLALEETEVSAHNENSPPTCSVIICTQDRPAQLESCLRALADQDYPKTRLEILVVDNGPQENPLTEQIAKRWNGKLIREPQPGLSRARNAGARACRTAIVAYLDDDAIANPNWVRELAKELSDPAVAVVTGKVLPLKTETEAERLFANLGGFASFPEERTQVDIHTAGWFELANFGGIGVGTNMAFRRKLFERWCGFNERLGAGAALPGCEEYYAFFSLIDQGCRIIYTPGAIVRHPSPATMEELRVRFAEGIKVTAAYVTLMLMEEERYRAATLACILRWLLGKRKVMAKTFAKPSFLSSWKRLESRLAGCWLYFRYLSRARSREAFHLERSRR